MQRGRRQTGMVVSPQARYVQLLVIGNISARCLAQDGVVVAPCPSTSLVLVSHGKHPASSQASTNIPQIWPLEISAVQVALCL